MWRLGLRPLPSRSGVAHTGLQHWGAPPCVPGQVPATTAWPAPDPSRPWSSLPSQRLAHSRVRVYPGLRPGCGVDAYGSAKVTVQSLAPVMSAAPSPPPPSSFFPSLLSPFLCISFALGHFTIRTLVPINSPRYQYTHGCAYPRSTTTPETDGQSVPRGCSPHTIQHKKGGRHGLGGKAQLGSGCMYSVYTAREDNSCDGRLHERCSNTLPRTRNALAALGADAAPLALLTARTSTAIRPRGSVKHHWATPRHVSNRESCQSDGGAVTPE